MTLSHDDLVDYLKDSADAAADLRELEAEALERERELRARLTESLDLVFRLRGDLEAWTRAAWYWWRGYRTLAGRLGLEVPPAPSPLPEPMTDTPAKKKKTPPDVELSSIRRIVAVLEPLSPAARARILRFVNERLEEERAAAASPHPFSIEGRLAESREA